LPHPVRGIPCERDRLGRIGTVLADNRLALIRSWSMDGACEDVDRRFESSPDMEALGVERAEDELPPTLLKPTGGDGWRPLAADPAY
jgi:hypothetical protein